MRNEREYSFICLSLIGGECLRLRIGYLVWTTLGMLPNDWSSEQPLPKKFYALPVRGGGARTKANARRPQTEVDWSLIISLGNRDKLWFQTNHRPHEAYGLGALFFSSHGARSTFRFVLKCKIRKLNICHCLCRSCDFRFFLFFLQTEFVDLRKVKILSTGWAKIKPGHWIGIG